MLNLAGNGGVEPLGPRRAAVRRLRPRDAARHDWIFPTFNAEPRYHKPILIYWLMRLGVAIGGDNPFGMRLVSGFAGAGTCLLVWGLGRRMFGPQVGRLAALILATAPIMLIESKLATTDATLAFWFVGGQFCLWELSQRPSRRVAAVVLAAAGAGDPDQGAGRRRPCSRPSGLVSWWWGGPTACWKRLDWRRGLIILAAVTLPWFVAIGIVSHGDFYRVAVGFHIIQRVTSGIEEHGGFPGLLRGPVAVDLLSLVGAPARGRLRRLVAAADRPGVRLPARLDRRPARLPRVVRTKLIHYYLPAYPACALLVAWLVVTLVREEVTLRRWPLGRLALGLLNSIGIGTVVAPGRRGLRRAGAGPLALPGAGRWCWRPGPSRRSLRLYRGATERGRCLADRHLGGSWAS